MIPHERAIALDPAARETPEHGTGAVSAAARPARNHPLKPDHVATDASAEDRHEERR